MTSTTIACDMWCDIVSRKLRFVLEISRGIRRQNQPGLLENKKSYPGSWKKKTTYPGGWKTRNGTRVGGKQAISHRHSQFDDHKEEYSSPVHRIRIVGIAGITPRARYDAYSSMTVQQFVLFVENLENSWKRSKQFGCFYFFNF